MGDTDEPSDADPCCDLGYSLDLKDNFWKMVVIDIAHVSAYHRIESSPQY